MKTYLEILKENLVGKYLTYYTYQHPKDVERFLYSVNHKASRNGYVSENKREIEDVYFEIAPQNRRNTNINNLILIIVLDYDIKVPVLYGQKLVLSDDRWNTDLDLDETLNFE